ncbi:ABC transporter ATP-binding protein [Phenylobacterium sp.]|uniref:ABC transporter ATP-binding protein n=1 Tax=Phenylobacterium sp. TaxID=1871053 RepID=UPI0035B1398F
MSNEIAISAQGLGKRYKRQIAGSRSDSLRDAIRNGAKTIMSGGAARTHETFWALRDASFEIARGENVGIIGLNGAGKSTLLKLLSRITTPTTGSARITGRMGALLEVGTGFHGELTGRENTFLYGSILGMSRAEVARKFDAIVEFAEIGEFIDMPVKRYSSGMYVRLAFAVAAHLDPDILLLDEVLAVGDFTFQRKCMDFAASLEQKGSTILFVSHNMFSIKSMCERVIYLRRGQIVYDGPTDEGLKLYEADSRLSTAAWFDDDSTQPAMRITDVELMDETGAEANVIDYGKSLTVRIHYKTFRPIERPDFRVGINRSDEVHCSTYSSFSDNVNIPMIDGEGVVELRTPPMTLVSELYTANVSVREKGYGRVVCAQIGGHFHLRHPVFASNAFGVYHEAADWIVGDNVAKIRAAG